jgi:hypothetical protein
MWLMTHGLGGLQNDDNCEASIERYAAAAVDLDTYALLGM